MAIDLDRDLMDGASTSDIFAYGLARVDRVGPCSRLTFYVPVRCGGKPAAEIVVNLVVPSDQLAEIGRVLMTESGRDLTGENPERPSTRTH